MRTRSSSASTLRARSFDDLDDPVFKRDLTPRSYRASRAPGEAPGRVAACDLEGAVLAGLSVQASRGRPPRATMGAPGCYALGAETLPSGAPTAPGGRPGHAAPRAACLPPPAR